MSETDIINKPVIDSGGRKVVLTKWMLVIFTLGTFGYFILLALKGDSPPDSFFMNFVLGLSTIGGMFTAGNVFEHKEKTAQLKIKEPAEIAKAKSTQADSGSAA